MKKLYLILLLLTCSVAAALAQSGRDLYNKYSDLPGMEAVYISPAMFRLMGRIPDVEFQDGDVDFSPIIKSLNGFYLLNTADQQNAAKLMDDVKRFVSCGRYEILMEAKSDGEVARIYAVGDDKIVTSLVLVATDPGETAFIAMDGKMDRAQLEDILAQAAAE